MEDALRKVLGILISLTIFVTANAFAADAPRTVYRAQFDWVTEGSVKRRMELRVFEQKSEPFAEIRHGSHVIARCPASSLSREQIELECRSPGLDRLAVAATLLPSGTLRLGNWLQGIDTVHLEVRENRLARPVLASAANAKR